MEGTAVSSFFMIFNYINKNKQRMTGCPVLCQLRRVRYIKYIRNNNSKINREKDNILSTIGKKTPTSIGERCIAKLSYSVDKDVKMQYNKTEERKEETICQIKPANSDSIQRRHRRSSLQRHSAVSALSTTTGSIERSASTKKTRRP